MARHRRRDLSKNQLLWLDLLDPSADEENEVRAAFGLDTTDRAAPRRRRRTAELEQTETHIRVTSIAVSTAESDPKREAVVIELLHRRELGR